MSGTSEVPQLADPLCATRKSAEVGHEQTWVVASRLLNADGEAWVAPQPYPTVKAVEEKDIADDTSPGKKDTEHKQKRLEAFQLKFLNGSNRKHPGLSLSLAGR